MDINMKIKIYILFICFLTLTAFLPAEERRNTLSDVNKDLELRKINLDLLYPIKQATSKDLISANGPQRIIMDSRVIYDQDNILFNIEGMKKKGNYATFIDFKFDLDEKNKLTGIKKEIEQILPTKELSLKQEELLSKSIEKNTFLKLVINQNNNKSFITNGRLIVHFKEVFDFKTFEEEYGLKQVYDFDIIKVYEPSNFKTINEKIELIESDPRIKSITLDKVAESINLR